MDHHIGINVGDRVELIRNCPDGNEQLTIGCLGTVCSVPDPEGTGDFRYGVRWDLNISAHNCNGRCALGHGWYVDEEDIRICVENSENDCIPFKDSDLRSLFG